MAGCALRGRPLRSGVIPGVDDAALRSGVQTGDVELVFFSLISALRNSDIQLCERSSTSEPITLNQNVVAVLYRLLIGSLYDVLSVLF